MSVLSYVAASDDRVSGRVVAWRPPRWVRLWMLWATRAGDGWLWGVMALLLAAAGLEGLKVLGAVAVSAGLANTLLVLTKRRVHRARPCERARPAHFDVDPLTWFEADRFSFPSGHTMTAFAVHGALQGSTAAIGCFTLPAAVLIGLSRMFLGLHYPSDVVTGCLLGYGIGVGTRLALAALAA
jgi:undecaprenyl-diphosphatase